MKKVICMILVSLGLWSCNIPASKNEGKSDGEPLKTVQKKFGNSKEYASKATLDSSIALKFINDYADHCMPNNQDLDTNWISNNNLLTDNFKKRYNFILDSACRVDPELGLGFDPIFDAQDFPDKGFEIAGCDQDGYITVKGKDWPDFLLVMKMDYQDDRWLVDGAGIINIPENKRAKR